MLKPLSIVMVLSALTAFAEPSVLELGFKPEAKDAAAAAPVEISAPVEASASETSETSEPGTNAVRTAKRLTGRAAKITSDATVYNRKEGIVSFEGHVHVDDEQYQMHADRVYLFLEGTNDLKRIVALGHVAMTNETRRAYGAKATYTKKNGLVQLFSGEGAPAEVRDESKAQDQVVRGSRIRFWIDSEQVEVDAADISGPAPSGGAESLKKVINR